MVTEDIIVDGKKETIIIKLPDDEYEDYQDDNLADTAVLDDVVEELRKNNE